MIRTISIGLSILLGAVSGVYAQKTIVTVEANQQGNDISPDLFGIFFEDLNYAADGGLYAELAQNRSFEYSPTEQPDWNPLSFWQFQKRGGAEGSIKVNDIRPIHENNPHYVLLTVLKPGDGVGLANSGFDGIPVKAGETYEASFWAYQAFMNDMWGSDNGIEGHPMPVTLQLEGKNGEVLAKASLQVTGRKWQRFSAKLAPTRADNEGRLVLLAQAKGGICVDMVSLFPTKTFRDRPNGLRADLAQAIADLKPKFMRFPGGCLAHGDGLHTYYNWKESVGPVETRKNRRNSWGYDQTRGLGYFEMFQFCEDIGAKPLPVVSAGVCCQHSGSSPNHGQEGLPMEEMAAYLQDILDLVEWANGPATSKWGSARAAAGHPQPFGLKYLGLGNEDAITPVFKERFRMLQEAIKKKHPEIVVIGTSGPFAEGEDFTNGWAFAKEMKLDMVDEHYYKPPQWFWDNLGRYDAYDRNGPKVYAGEYAAHDRDKTKNSLRSAIAEAAALASFERNGDVVQLASYAPLLSRRGHTQWHPDMIYFDASEVFLTPNYYAQQLFMRNCGDACVPTSLSVTSKSPTLSVSAVRDTKTNLLFVKIVNGANATASLTVELAGVPERELQAVRTVLTGPTADSFNEDGKPAAIKPVASEVAIKTTFDYEAPANSLTVFRIRE
jgi:alpha-L-arabinofuranosidase